MHRLIENRTLPEPHYLANLALVEFLDITGMKDYFLIFPEVSFYGIEIFFKSLVLILRHDDPAKSKLGKLGSKLFSL